MSSSESVSPNSSRYTNGSTSLSDSSEENFIRKKLDSIRKDVRIGKDFDKNCEIKSQKVKKYKIKNSKNNEHPDEISKQVKKLNKLKKASYLNLTTPNYLECKTSHKMSKNVRKSHLKLTKSGSTSSSKISKSPYNPENYHESPESLVGKISKRKGTINNPTPTSLFTSLYSTGNLYSSLQHQPLDYKLNNTSLVSDKNKLKNIINRGYSPPPFKELYKEPYTNRSASAVPNFDFDISKVKSHPIGGYNGQNKKSSHKKSSSLCCTTDGCINKSTTSLTNNTITENKVYNLLRSETPPPKFKPKSPLTNCQKYTTLPNKYGGLGSSSDTSPKMAQNKLNTEYDYELTPISTVLSGGVLTPVYNRTLDGRIVQPYLSTNELTDNFEMLNAQTLRLLEEAKPKSASVTISTQTPDWEENLEKVKNKSLNCSPLSDKDLNLNNLIYNLDKMNVKNTELKNSPSNKNLHSKSLALNVKEFKRNYIKNGSKNRILNETKRPNSPIHANHEAMYNAIYLPTTSTLSNIQTSLILSNKPKNINSPSKISNTVPTNIKTYPNITKLNVINVPQHTMNNLKFIQQKQINQNLSTETPIATNLILNNNNAITISSSSSNTTPIKVIQQFYNDSSGNTINAKITSNNKPSHFRRNSNFGSTEALNQEVENYCTKPDSKKFAHQIGKTPPDGRRAPPPLPNIILVQNSPDKNELKTNVTVASQFLCVNSENLIFKKTPDSSNHSRQGSNNSVASQTQINYSQSSPKDLEKFGKNDESQPKPRYIPLYSPVKNSQFTPDVKSKCLHGSSSSSNQINLSSPGTSNYNSPRPSSPKSSIQRSSPIQIVSGRGEPEGAESKNPSYYPKNSIKPLAKYPNRKILEKSGTHLQYKVSQNQWKAKSSKSNMSLSGCSTVSSGYSSSYAPSMISSSSSYSNASIRGSFKSKNIGRNKVGSQKSAFSSACVKGYPQKQASRGIMSVLDSPRTRMSSTKLDATLNLSPTLLPMKFKPEKTKKKPIETLDYLK